jgi:hypothetical protein
MAGMITRVTPAGSFDSAEDGSAVDRLVLSTVNAPYRRDINAAKLVNCIRNAELNEWPAHIAAFFTDVSPDLVLGFARVHGISEPSLWAAYLAVRSQTGERNPNLEGRLVAMAASA